jgi:hypothetical protein
MDMKNSTGKAFNLALFILVLVFLTACGVKAPVKPPLPHLPKAPGGLAMHQTGASFLVSWTIPKANEDGSPLQDLQGFDVYKTRYELSSGCPECNESNEVFRHLDLEYLQQASRDGDTLFFRDFDLKPDVGYRYKVTPFNRTGQQGESTAAQKAFLVPPPPPVNLQARSEEGSITLDWSPSPAEKSKKPGFLGYNIYRQVAGTPAPRKPMNEDYWADNAFTDSTVGSGKTYTYTLRSVWRLDDLIIESGDSAPVTLGLP